MNFLKYSTRFVINRKSFVFITFALIFIFSFSLKKILPIDNFYRSQVRVSFDQIELPKLFHDFRRSRFAKEIADDIVNPTNLESFFGNKKMLISYQIIDRDVFSFTFISDIKVSKELFYKYIFKIKSMYESRLISSYIDYLFTMSESKGLNCVGGYNNQLENKTSYFYRNITNNSLSENEMEGCFESNGYKVSWLKKISMPSVVETNMSLLSFTVIDKFSFFPEYPHKSYSTINNLLFSLFVSILFFCFVIIYNFRSGSKP